MQFSIHSFSSYYDLLSLMQGFYNILLYLGYFFPVPFANDISLYINISVHFCSTDDKIFLCRKLIVFTSSAFPGDFV